MNLEISLVFGHIVFFLESTGNGLFYKPMMSGTLPQALSAEKTSILSYRQMLGKLPPGNKMVK